MNPYALIAVVALAPYVLGPVAYASTPNCSKPPYGASESGYASYQKTLGDILPASNIFPRICRAKFDHEGRRWFRMLLGFSNRQIDASPVTTTAIAVEMALARIARERARERRQDGVYAIFLCVPAVGTCSIYTTFGPYRSRSACEDMIAKLPQPDPPSYYRCLFHRYSWQP